MGVKIVFFLGGGGFEVVEQRVADAKRMPFVDLKPVSYHRKA